MTKKNHMAEAGLADIEQTQKELRTSIEASKALTEKSEQLIARHRQQVESGPATARPVSPSP